MNTSSLLFQAFSSHNGKLSSTRMQSSVVTFVIMGVWAFLSVTRRELLEIPEYLSLMVVGGIGLTAYRSSKEPSPGKTPDKKDSPNG